LYDRHLAPTGLSVSQFSILRLLKEHGRLKISQLAEIMIMERTSLVRALKPLQASDWVVAERSGDGRAFDVTLSTSGMEKVSEAIPLWAEAQAAFEGEVGRDDAVRFRKMIWELNLGG
jgi:DNA-binding MarR family transcriptional regulator